MSGDNSPAMITPTPDAGVVDRTLATLCTRELGNPYASVPPRSGWNCAPPAGASVPPRSGWNCAPADGIAPGFPRLAFHQAPEGASIPPRSGRSPIADKPSKVRNRIVYWIENYCIRGRVLNVGVRCGMPLQSTEWRLF
jgi:hypothetical protein